MLFCHVYDFQIAVNDWLLFQIIRLLKRFEEELRDLEGGKCVIFGDYGKELVILRKDKLLDLHVSGHVQGGHGLGGECATIFVLVDEELLEDELVDGLALRLLEALVLRPNEVESVVFEAVEDDRVEVSGRDALDR